MSVIAWDQVGDRVYESGLDRGVLYLPDGGAVPWNGLTSIDESFDKSTTPIYFDGLKIYDAVTLGDFSATMKAITYPDEFLEFEGIAKTVNGAYLGDQLPKTFSLSYRTKINNDTHADGLGYKIHILYDVLAIPSNRTYESLSADPTFVDFEWKITATPQRIPDSITGFRPTAHIILDSRELNSGLLTLIESTLYGTSGTDPVLMSLGDLLEMIMFLVEITDNGDGTWTATSFHSGYITDNGDGSFSIAGATVTIVDSNTYTISDTST